ncbi:lysine 2 3-aminomutase YjeK [Candidatus Pantoea carbekii]|uniref:L-lysine 2,3-aminomutase n=2 Tax=Candidatus Pantoea carbekii TaxID=1235990 RepID=U3U5Z0_9GAMM|nr:lysine 2 3-aminomutase YjeK [Candidatus Pantoea carbekii]BAO00310.1 YjeK protein [Candidatus Pantoea carbekii]
MTTHSHLNKNWIQQLSNVVTDPHELLKMLALDQHKNLIIGANARTLFPLRVPLSFIQRMTIGNPQDPLLLQVLTSSQEFNNVIGYHTDPLNEYNSMIIPNLLHKYKNRVLLLTKGACAINCRYCFRRYFPYQHFPFNKSSWKIAINYISSHLELDEVILSGGDPLMAKDHELAWLVKLLSNIPHLKRLRIHSRLPVVIPSRITEQLCEIFFRTRLQVLLVSHINHKQEINSDLYYSMKMLTQSGVTLLNQSVLLRNVNDKAETLANLSNSLFDIGILPYYLHVLDKVKGTAHFFVSDDQACALVRELLTMVSGYMVPKLTREIIGELSKTPLDLYSYKKINDFN